MTRKVYNVGGGRHSEAALSALLSQLLNGDVARGLNIEPTGSAGLSVRIAAGTGQIRVSQFHSRVIQSDAAETTTAVPAPTSNPRRNLVVAYIDPAVTPTTSVVDNINGVFKFAVIQGAEAATPQIPTNTTVTAALGTENWIPLGDFRTNVGATSVVLANITDQRRMILVTADKLYFATFGSQIVTNSSSVNVSLQSSSPATVASLTVGVSGSYLITGNLLWSVGPSAIDYEWKLRIDVNGVPVFYPTINAMRSHGGAGNRVGSFIQSLNTGDVVTLRVTSGGGPATDGVIAAGSSSLSIVRV